MITRNITYTDFLGNQRTEEVYFHLSQTELTEFAMDLPDDVFDTFRKDPDMSNEKAAVTMLDKLGNKGVYKFIKDLLLKAYGVVVDDGRRFEKNEQLTTEFSQTVIFDTMLAELLSDDVKAAEFVNAVIPADLAAKTAQRETPAIPAPPVKKKK